MYRIAHISDLHISDIEPGEMTNLQWLGKFVAMEKKVDVVADGHDEHKLGALKNIFRRLRPNLIVVTGDVTNYGDRKSFELAGKILADLQKVARADRVLCVPGNHDSLSERVAELRRKGRLHRALIKLVSLFNQEAAIMRQTSFDPALKEVIEDGDLPLLSNYKDCLVGETFGEVNPSRPFFVEVPWGEIAFFLFNSTNDSGYMANEGKIGQRQYNALNEVLDDPDAQQRLARAVRVALLHHHPINNPAIEADKVERGYNSMSDGSTFMTYIGRRGFHFILHGHQHVPYMWEMEYGKIPNISSAGSALAGSDPAHGSFNLIDIINPFEAIYRQYDYSRTGYEVSQESELKLKIKPLSRIRVTPDDEPERAEDLAIRTLFQGRPEAYDEANKYDLLEYDVTVTRAQLYQARYRRVGTVVEGAGAGGLIFVITGSPAMEYEEMDVKASDAEGRELRAEILNGADFPTQKVIIVHHYVPLTPGQSFDVTLHFKWQASAAEPNDFDGLNLFYYKHPVGRLVYRARLPWRPVDSKVIAYGLIESPPLIPKLTPQAEGTYLYSFELENPPHQAYLIWFREQH